MRGKGTQSHQRSVVFVVDSSARARHSRGPTSWTYPTYPPQTLEGAIIDWFLFFFLSPRLTHSKHAHTSLSGTNRSFAPSTRVERDKSRIQIHQVDLPLSPRACLRSRRSLAFYSARVNFFFQKFGLTQWRESTPWIEVAPKYSVSTEA